jgi:acetolactate synthase-1/2/3 large subunit
MPQTGGDHVADELVRQHVPVVFTLCGGHISPILVSARARGVRVVDVRDEATAVFAADAVARLTGVPGLAAVTAGPGVTNTITALKNAQLAQSPVVLLGGATATVLKGRGALQDIDQAALVRPHVKWLATVGTVSDLGPAVARAFAEARAGVPGPVFVECPVDLLYPAALVREWYLGKPGGAAASVGARLERWYLTRHLAKVFAARDREHPSTAASAGDGIIGIGRFVARAGARLARAERPVLVVGSQAVGQDAKVMQLAAAIARLGIPTYLSGMARGLLGREHAVQFRHKRKEALREADLVILAGTPCDFRLEYGRHISRRAALVAVNRSPEDLVKNRRPQVGVLGPPDVFLRALADASPPAPSRWAAWTQALRAREDARDREIDAQAAEPAAPVSPLRVCRAIEAVLPDDSIVVADGGDFVATASYVVRPRRPLSWLDPGVFGTLGVGAGFALGAHLARPSAEIWAVYGDGAFGFSVSELDSLVRHRVPLVAVIGNDGRWNQIARDQVAILGDDVATGIGRADYHAVAEGFGARGLLLDDPDRVEAVFAEAQAAARGGRPVVVNALIGDTGFRKGSLSI